TGMLFQRLCANVLPLPWGARRAKPLDGLVGGLVKSAGPKGRTMIAPQRTELALSALWDLMRDSGVAGDAARTQLLFIFDRRTASAPPRWSAGRHPTKY